MKFSAFDIETFLHNDKQIPYCVSIFHTKIENFYGLDCLERMLDFIQNLEGRCVIYAHNLTFDGSFLLDELSKKDRGVRLETFMFNNDIYTITIDNVEFKCTYRLFPYSLSRAEKLLGTRGKLDMDHGCVGLDNFLDEDVRSKVIQYCNNDVMVVVDIINTYRTALESLIPDWQKSNSISSLSLRMFKKLYNAYSIQTKISLDDDLKFRPSYFGGRCEIFGNPESGERVFHFDFPGMYSQVMAEEYPIGYFFLEYPQEVEQIGFYHVDVYSDMEIPILPFRDGNSGKLLFPNGEFSGLYWYEELLFFIKRGGLVKKISYAYVFKKKGRVFKKFADEVSKHRGVNRQNNFIFKLINNSLYGRFGFSNKSTITKIVKSGDFNVFEMKNNIVSYYKFNNFFIANVKLLFNEEDTIKSNVIYASIITSKARIKLYKGFLSVQESGGRVLYTDTDSIFAAYKEDVLGKKYGEVFWDPSKSDTEILKALFIQPKLYAVIYKDGRLNLKMKGIKNPQLTFEDIVAKFQSNDSHTFIQTQLKLKNLTFKEVDLLKSIQFSPSFYNKRIFSEDFKRTRPIFLKQE